jgi:hypothetical protein
MMVIAGCFEGGKGTYLRFVVVMETVFVKPHQFCAAGFART